MLEAFIVYKLKWNLKTRVLQLTHWPTQLNMFLFIIFDKRSRLLCRMKHILHGASIDHPSFSQEKRRQYVYTVPKTKEAFLPKEVVNIIVTTSPRKVYVWIQQFDMETRKKIIWMVVKFVEGMYLWMRNYDEVDEGTWPLKYWACWFQGPRRRKTR